MGCGASHQPPATADGAAEASPPSEQAATVRMDADAQDAAAMMIQDAVRLKMEPSAYGAGGTPQAEEGAAAPHPLPPDRPPGAPAWEAYAGAFVQMKCRDTEAASACITQKRAEVAALLEAGAGPTRCELFGTFTDTPTPPYGTRPLAGGDDPALAAWLELYGTEAALAEGVAATGEGVAALGAQGDGTDLETLEGPMYLLERAGGGAATHAVMVCCLAKDAEAATAMVEIAYHEVAVNLEHEPAFVRGVVIPPPVGDPLKVRWTVQWTSREGVLAHQEYEHHKVAGPKIMQHLDFSWGGALEYDKSFHLSRGAAA